MNYVLRFYLIAVVLLLAVCAFTVPTYADTQSVTGCSGCNGYSFSAELTPTGTPGHFTLIYTVTNVTGAAAYGFNWSLTLFDPNQTISAVTLNSVTETNNVNNFTSDYAAKAGKSNNGNASCNATISNALCVEPIVAITSLPSIGVGQSLTFNLSLTCTNCTELANWIFLASGDCVANTHANCYAISAEGVGVVPEPSSLALLGASGLVGLCSFVGRKLRPLTTKPL